MVIFHSYVKLPEGTHSLDRSARKQQFGSGPRGPARPARLPRAPAPDPPDMVQAVGMLESLVNDSW